jgi:hypothetical protein
LAITVGFFELFFDRQRTQAPRQVAAILRLPRRSLTRQLSAVGDSASVTLVNDASGNLR